MFNAWRKAWAKEIISAQDSSSSALPGAAALKAQSFLEPPETSVDGTYVLADPLALDSTETTIQPVPEEKSASVSVLLSANVDRTLERRDHDLPPPAKRRKLVQSTDTPTDDTKRIVSSDADAQFAADLASASNTIISFASPNLEALFLSTLLTKICGDQSALSERGHDRRVALIVAASRDRVTMFHDMANRIPHVESSYTLQSPPAESEGPNFDPDLPDIGTVDILALTAPLLLYALSKKLLLVDQINVLILDDADQARFDHPLAHIMLDYYHSSTPTLRPRIVGLMQATISITTDLLLAESNCDAELYGLTKEIRTDLESKIIQVEEIVTFYEPALVKRETTLCTQLRVFDPHNKVLKLQFAGAAATLRDVGPCAADLVWRRHLGTLDQELRGGSPDFTGDDAVDDASAEIFRIKVKIRNLLKEWTFTMPNLNPSSKSFNVTPKFAKLVQILQCFEMHGEHFRGLILVQKRSTAATIADMLRTIGDSLSFLRPQVLIGHDKFGMDIATQRDVVEEFRTGKINLLVATRVAEDGVELPMCSCVIRFDLFENHISYALSRARANQQAGHFILMVEQNNDAHRRIIHSVARLEPAMRNWVHAVAITPGGVVPPPSLLERSHEDKIESDDDEGTSEDCILDPTTGGRIYAKDAAGVVYKYVALHSEKRSSKPLFEYRVDDGGKFRCTVVLPRNGPLTSVTGPPGRSKNEARRLVCYDACVELYEQGYLDHTIFPRPPTIRSFLPDIYADFDIEPDWAARGKGPKVPNPMANVTTDTHGKLIKGKTAGTRCYARKRPAFWKNSLALGFKGKLFATVVRIDLSNVAEDPYRTLCILSRHPLPSIEPLRIFISGYSVEVILCKTAAIPVSGSDLDKLHQYTVRVCRAITGKPLENSIERIPYFLAPLKSDWTPPMSDDASPEEWGTSVHHGISWGEINAGAENFSRPLRTSTINELQADLEDAMIQEKPTEFSRRHDVIRIRRDLTPLSKPETPKDISFETYLDQAVFRRKGFEALRDDEQPMIEVRAASEVVNRLSPAINAYTNIKQEPIQHLIPELSALSTIPASVYRMALLLPSIIRRIDDYLLVKELNAKVFDNWLQEKTLLVAITSPSVCTDFDYERQELLGDAYLKYLSSIYLFVMYPTQPEGAMHMSRQRIISNRVLLQRARDSDIPQYIQSKVFTPKYWVPYNYKVTKRIREPLPTETSDPSPQVDIPSPDSHDVMEEEETAEDIDMADADVRTISNTNTSEALPFADINMNMDVAPSVVVKAVKPRRQWEDTRVHWLGDKAVADVTEALIGAAYITGGIESALKISKDLGCYLPRVDRWSDFGRKVLAPPPELTADLSPAAISAIEKIIGAQVKKPHIMAQALTHTSIHGNETPCYERLEFLGDAVLDFLVVNHIYNLHETLNPGALTLLKGGMVTNLALAAICVETGLYKFIIHESPVLETQIREYVRQIQRARDLEYKVAEAEGRSPGQYWVDVEPPKTLSDVVESLLGAILVLDNFDSQGTERVYDQVIRPFFDKHITVQNLAHHPTKVLFELFQGRGCTNFEIAEFTTTGEDAEGNTLVEGVVRCDVICHDVILASACDSNLVLASRRCCYMALDALEGDSEFLARVCRCRAEQAALRRLALASKERAEATTTRSTAADSPSLKPDSTANGGDSRMEYDNKDGDEAAVENALHDGSEEEGEIRENESMILDNY